MKKIMVIVVMLMVMAVLNAIPCSASLIDISDKLSKIELKQGVAYSANDKHLNYLATIPVINLKNGFVFELGYASDADDSDHKAIIVFSYPVAKFSELPFVKDVPILNLVDINVGGYFGYGSINMTELKEAKVDYGPSVTLLNFKF